MKNQPFLPLGNRLMMTGLLAVLLFGLSAFTMLHTDPVARLGSKNGGTIFAEDFKKETGINAVIDNGTQVKECKVVSFNMVRVGKKEDPVEVINYQQDFNKKAKELVDLAKAGDIYYFDKVNAKCPGDVEDRKLNSLVFKIK